ncbi:T9SS type A sorting domain-containing protein [uncultured Chryseobacterium sp.]|uniref:T9SS type A sorting domain-containing protein n=1 Tax=uncultured Chryseobacterium sp. TaxID=259322 RepID=UPI0025D5AD40|nr:T9SS type A sorting domain-containing protein [uncultured Chryseobacterium sp.]
MNFKLHTTSKILYAFLMALFSVWGWGQKTYQLITDASGLTAGSKYLIVNRNTEGSGYALSSQSANNRARAAVNVTSALQIVTTPAASTSDTGAFEITLGGNTGSWTLYDPVNPGYLYAASSSNNYLKTQNTSTTWTITFSSGSAILTSQTNVSRNVLMYNNLFSCYAAVQNPVYLFKEVLYTAVPTVTGSNQTITVGTAFSYQVQATEYPSSFTIASGSLPSGLSMSSSGLISGTPNAVGTSSAGITATNNLGTSSPATINFNVQMGNQSISGFTDTSVNLGNSSTVTLPAQTDQGLTISYTSSNSSIASVSGNTLTFAQPGSVNITANQPGNSNYNSLNIVRNFTASNVCFNEDFSSITSGNNSSTSGSNTTWNGNANFITANTAYNAGGAVRLGSSSSPGSMTSLVLNNIAGNVTVSFGVKGWSSVEGDIEVTMGGQTQTISYTSVISGSFQNKALSFSNIPLGSTLKIATVAGRAFIDDVSISCGTATTWSGSWSNGLPTSTSIVVINENYSGGSFSSQSVNVNSSKTLTINSGEVVTTGDTVNNGIIVVNNGGNFIQTSGSAYSGNGVFTVNKSGTSALNKYAFWSSPVANQNLFTAYSNGSSSTAPLYVMSYDPATNLYPTVANDNANFANNAGKGYSVKVPATNASLVFGGASQVPNNGTINVALSNAGDGYNLIGNPYPSNISLADFYTANNSAIEPTLWFWDNTTGNVTTQTGNTSVNVGFATFNAQSGTWTEAPNTQSYSSAALNSLGSFAKISQGFIVKSINGTAATFTNAMRTSAAAVTTNKNVNPAEGKYWIRLTTSYGNALTQAITYNQGASDAYDGYDSRAMGMGSDAFYSLAGTERLVIQGRAPFQINDVVPLGNKHFENGNFTISLSHKEGLFTNGQPIYLHDKQIGTYTDLQSGNYTFAANAGDFTNRFEIVYKLNVLSTNETEKGTFEVYRDGEDFVVRNHHNIQSVEVFDAAGRKIQQISANSKSVIIKLQTKGVYILKAVSGGKQFTQKIIK